MSDYLSNLVTRSLPSVSPIKPRLASLFEPDSLSVSRLPYQPPNELETSRQVAGEIEPSRQVAREIERRSVVDTQPIAAASTEPPPRTEARVGQTQEGRSSRDQRNEPAGLSLDPTASHVSVDQPSVTGRPAATLSPTSDQHSLDAPPTARLVETRDRERTTETISKDTTWPRPEH